MTNLITICIGILLCDISIYLVKLMIYSDFDLSDLFEWFIGLWKKKRIPKNGGNKQCEKNNKDKLH